MEEDIDHKSSYKKALKELAKATAYYTELPDEEPEPMFKNWCTFFSNLASLERPKDFISLLNTEFNTSQ